MAVQSDNLKVDLNHLRELAKQRIVENESTKVDSIVKSLHVRLDYAHYHFHEFKNILSKIDTDLSKIKMVFLQDSEEQKNHILIKANISACIQSIHISHDILAYLLATVLNLNLSEREITFNKVKDKVKNYDKLKKLMDEFSNGDDYIYLTSYVNHTKHRFHIESNITYHLIGEKHYTAEFEPFEFNGKPFQKQNIEEFLIREYNREQKLILDIENELINILEPKQGQN